MKKTLALLLCLVMMVTAFSFNAFALGTVDVVTHASRADGKTEFAIDLKGFDSLRAFDLVVEMSEGVEILSAEAVDIKLEDPTSTFALDKDYTISTDKRTLHVVGLTDVVDGATILVNVKITGSTAQTATITAVDLAKSRTELYAAGTYTIGEAGTIVPYIAPTPVESTETVAQPEVTADTFIPYGSVYYTDDDGNVKFVPKELNGDFDVAKVTDKANYATFKKPAKDANGNHFGTFGVSASLKPGVVGKQFGNYAEGYTADKKYGTLVIVGDWEGYSSWYLLNKAWNDITLSQALYDAYMNVYEQKGDTFDFVKFTKDGSTIKVYKVDQVNWMWKNAEKGIFEYAVRVVGLQANENYAAIAFCDGKMGSEMRSFKYTVAAN